MVFQSRTKREDDETTEICSKIADLRVGEKQNLIIIITSKSSINVFFALLCISIAIFVVFSKLNLYFMMIVF